MDTIKPEVLENYNTWIADTKPSFQRGYKDFWKGRVANPYFERTMSYREWTRGFNAAYAKNLRQLKSDNKSSEVIKEISNKRSEALQRLADN